MESLLSTELENIFFGGHLHEQCLHVHTKHPVFSAAGVKPAPFL
jgi:hypothetical protein